MKGTPLMTKNINKNVHNTGLSGIRLVSNFIKKPANEVIQLTVGEIDLPTPFATKQAALKRLSKITQNILIIWVY